MKFGVAFTDQKFMNAVILCVFCVEEIQNSKESFD